MAGDDHPLARRRVGDGLGDHPDRRLGGEVVPEAGAVPGQVHRDQLHVRQQLAVGLPQGGAEPGPGDQDEAYGYGHVSTVARSAGAAAGQASNFLTMRWTVSHVRVVMSLPYVCSSQDMKAGVVPGVLLSMTARTTRAAGS